MPLTSDKADYNFKQSLGIATTRTDIEFYSEPIKSSPPVFPNRIWAEQILIPSTAPVLPDLGVSGVVQYFSKLTLLAQPGGKAFYHPNLINAIPFNYDPAGSYNYSVFKSDGTTPIFFGQGDWVLDPGSGVLTFYGVVPSGIPPKVSFWRYIGALGATITGGITTDANGITIAADGPNGSNPVNKAQAATVDNMYVRKDAGVTIMNGATPPGGLSDTAPYGNVDNDANTTTLTRKIQTLGLVTNSVIVFPSNAVNRQSYAVSITAHGTEPTTGDVFMKKMDTVFCYPLAAPTPKTNTNIGTVDGGDLSITTVANGYSLDITGITALNITWLFTITYSQYRIT
jgi:hypothetical protein